MRIRTALRISKVISTVLVACGMAIGTATFFATAHQNAQGLPGEKGDLGTFIILQDLVPVPEVPIPGAPVREALKANKLSDERFDLLSPSWKRGVAQLIKSGKCDRFDMEFAITGGDNVGFLLAKAQAIVESNCSADAVGKADDVGLNQVRAVACEEVNVKGNRTDAFINSLCAAHYRKALCTRFDACTSLASMYVAYNRGPTGAKRVANHAETDYVRKIDFTLRALIRSTR